MLNRQRRQQRLGAGIALAAMTAAVSAGCGSSSNTDTAHIRAVDVAVNAGNGSVTVNGGSIGGTQTFGQSTAYNFEGQNLATFSFLTDATLTSGITLPLSPMLQLNTGSYYTGYLIGRTDVNGKFDPRFLQAVVTGDRGASASYSNPTLYTNPLSGSVNIRILNAAPDAGTVDVRINGAPAFSGVTYPAFPTKSADGATVPAVNPVTAYQTFPAAGLTVQVNAAGTSTVLVPAAAISVSGGNAYTVLVTEPTTAPTYALQTVSDQP